LSKTLLPELRDYATFLASAGLTARGDPVDRAREAKATLSESEEGLGAEESVATTPGDEVGRYILTPDEGRADSTIPGFAPETTI
jgi:hypothetical protein